MEGATEWQLFCSHLLITKCHLPHALFLLFSVVAYLARFFYNKNAFLSAAGHREISFCKWHHNSRPQVDASYRLKVRGRACTRESQRCVLVPNLFGFIVLWKRSVPNFCSAKMLPVSVSFMSFCLVPLSVSVCGCACRWKPACTDITVATPLVPGLLSYILLITALLKEHSVNSKVMSYVCVSSQWEKLN